MIGAFLLNSATAQFHHSNGFSKCPEHGFVTLTNSADFLAADIPLNMYTPIPLANKGSDLILNGQGYSPQYNRIVGSNHHGAEGLFFAGPATSNGDTLGIDVKKITPHVTAQAGDVISDNTPGSVDIYYGRVDANTDMMVPLNDPDNLQAIYVPKTGADTYHVWDLAFVDAGAYGPDKRVWFSVISEGTNMVLMRGVVDMTDPLAPTVDVQKLGTLETEHPHSGGIIGAIFADNANNLYIGSNMSGMIYRIDVSEPTSPSLVAHEYVNGPVSIVNDGSRCRFAAMPDRIFSATVGTGSTIKDRIYKKFMNDLDAKADDALKIVGFLSEKTNSGISHIADFLDIAKGEVFAGGRKNVVTNGIEFVTGEIRHVVESGYERIVADVRKVLNTLLGNGESDSKVIADFILSGHILDKVVRDADNKLRILAGIGGLLKKRSDVKYMPGRNVESVRDIYHQKVDSIQQKVDSIQQNVGKAHQKVDSVQQTKRFITSAHEKYLK